MSASNVSAGRDVHMLFQVGVSPATEPAAPRLATVVQSPVLGTHTFFGREKELAEIESLLTDANHVQLRAALDGLPGIGKTELARQVVAQLAKGTKFPGGILWFDAEQADLRLQWASVAEKRVDLICPISTRARRGRSGSSSYSGTRRRDPRERRPSVHRDLSERQGRYAFARRLRHPLVPQDGTNAARSAPLPCAAAPVSVVAMDDLFAVPIGRGDG
jgi:hypothetical protein